MINEMTKYNVELVYSHVYNEFCIKIRHSDTGKVLSFREYDEWIQYVGGNPQ